MKLYHCQAARSLRPLWALEEMGLDYELEVMAFPPRFLHEGYVEKNPLGTVPYFEDGEVSLTESTGICHYLVETYGPTPLRVDPSEPDYGDYLNWLYRSDATLTFPQTIVLRYTQMEPLPELKKVPDDYTKWFFSRLRSVDEAVGEREYLCADRFTIADIAVGYAILLADVGLGLREKFKPQTEAYYQRLLQRPALQKAMAIQGPGYDAKPIDWDQKK